MFSPLPLLHATAINKKKSGDDKSVYSCPVYRYAKRTDRYLIFRVNLNSESEPPSKWKLKGVALLCARDWDLYKTIYKIQFHTYNSFKYVFSRIIISICNHRSSRSNLKSSDSFTPFLIDSLTGKFIVKLGLIYSVTIVLLNFWMGSVFS